MKNNLFSKILCVLTLCGAISQFSLDATPPKDCLKEQYRIIVKAEDTQAAKNFVNSLRAIATTIKRIDLEDVATWDQLNRYTKRWFEISEDAIPSNPLKNVWADFNHIDFSSSLCSLAKLPIDLKSNTYSNVFNRFTTAWFSQAEKDVNIKKFNAQDLANSIWAFATLGVQPQESFMNKWYERALQLLDQHNDTNFNAQDLTNSLWALASLNLQQNESMLNCIQELYKKTLDRLDSLEAIDLQQLFTAQQIFTELKNIKFNKQAQKVPKQEEQEAKKQARKERKEQEKKLKREKQVQEELNRAQEDELKRKQQEQEEKQKKAEIAEQRKLPDEAFKAGHIETARNNYTALFGQYGDLESKFRLGRIEEHQRNYSAACEIYQDILNDPTINTSELKQLKSKIVMHNIYCQGADNAAKKISDLNNESEEGLIGEQNKHRLIISILQGIKAVSQSKHPMATVLNANYLLKLSRFSGQKRFLDYFLYYFKEDITVVDIANIEKATDSTIATIEKTDLPGDYQLNDVYNIFAQYYDVMGNEKELFSDEQIKYLENAVKYSEKSNNKEDALRRKVAFGMGSLMNLMCKRSFNIKYTPKTSLFKTVLATAVKYFEDALSTNDLPENTRDYFHSRIPMFCNNNKELYKNHMRSLFSDNIRKKIDQKIA